MCDKNEKWKVSYVLKNEYDVRLSVVDCENGRIQQKLS